MLKLELCKQKIFLIKKRQKFNLTLSMYRNDVLFQLCIDTEILETTINV